MSPTSSTADAVARRLLAAALRATADESAECDGAWVAVAERGIADVADALSRWFGPYGYHALLTRALVSTRVAHPALGSVHIRGPLEPALDGLADASASFGRAAVADATVALIAAVVDLLGRMVGADMARHLLERSIAPPTVNAPDQSAVSGDEPISERVP